MPWKSFKEGKSIGSEGSESGIIIADDEHDLGARITLEKDGRTAPLSITCGIYGLLCHTRFFGDKDVAMHEFESMKSELARILLLPPITASANEEQALREAGTLAKSFVDKFP